MIHNIIISLRDLGKGATCLTPEWETCLGHAAIVCLESQGHKSGATMEVEGIGSDSYEVEWEQATEEILRCWQDEEETTEKGAYGIAILLIDKTVELKFVRQSRKYNGFDYWLAPKDAEYPFEETARVEVSGIRSGPRSRVKTRMKEKIDRLDRYSSTLPVFIVVIEFGSPLAIVSKK